MSDSMILSDREREVIRHSLGLDGRTKWTYRQYFAAGLDDKGVWDGLVARGLAVHWHNGFSPDDFYGPTTKAAEMVLEEGERITTESARQLLRHDDSITGDA